MKKQPEIDAIIDIFRTRESTALQLDEAAIQKEYEQANANRSGIAIKVLTVIGGFLVTCAFMGFLFLAGIYDSGFTMAATGFVFVAGALIIKKVYDILILDTFAVSFFVCGCLLILFGANETSMNETAICILFIILPVIAMGFVQNYMMAFAATCILHAAIIGLIYTLRLHSTLPMELYCSLVILFFTVWLLEEPRIIAGNTRISRLYNPVRLGTLAAILFSGIYLSGSSGLNWSMLAGWISSTIAIACSLLLVPRILKVLGLQQPSSTVPAFIAGILVLGPTLWAPGIAIALLIILASFYVNYKTGIVTGVVALLWFVSNFYYSLNLTLLTKSLMMMGTGLFFLLLYFATHKKLLSK